MWPFTKRKPEAEHVSLDGMGFPFVKNPNGHGSMVSAESDAAWQKWAAENPPPCDGYSYQGSAYFGRQWLRLWTAPDGRNIHAHTLTMAMSDLYRG